MPLRPFTHPVTAALALLAVSLLTAFAEAEQPESQASTVAGKPAAELLFTEGVALVERREYAAGCAKLEASEALDVAVGTLLHLADCYERLGKLASAWSRFREAQSLAQAQGMHERARIAGIRAEALGPRLARLSITVSGVAPRETEVRVGGALIPRSTWESALPFDPGAVLVQISAPGHVDYQRTVEIPARDAARVELVVPPLRKAVLPRPPRQRVTRRAEPAPSGTQRAVGIGTSIVGGLGLAAGGGLALFAKRRNDDSMKHCPRSPNLCTPRGLELRDQAGDLANAATVTASVSGAVLVTGLIVFVSAPRAVPADRAALWLTPQVSSGSFALSAHGSY